MGQRLKAEGVSVQNINGQKDLHRQKPNTLNNNMFENYDMDMIKKKSKDQQYNQNNQS